MCIRDSASTAAMIGSYVDLYRVKLGAAKRKNYSTVFKDFGYKMCIRDRPYFHQADGADGNKVVLIAGQGVVFFYDVCHQTQIVPDQFFPCGRVTGDVYKRQV